MFHALPPELPDDVLAKRKALPLKMTPVTLEGRFVRVAPLDVERDVEALYRISNGEPITIGNRAVEAYDADEMVWRWMGGGPFADAEAMKPYLQGSVDAPGLAMCVIDRELEHPVGVATYMNNVPDHLKVELGSIWYSPLAQRTKANLETTYLMLQHAFELGYRRLEWKCNALNERSRRAALRMGFTFEGIQDAHYIIKNRNRDTAWFRMLDSEWSTVKAQLEEMLRA
ncbi:MAG: GNAT family protein [Anaerolineae bacterium]